MIGWVRGRWRFEASPANLPLPRLAVWLEESEAPCVTVGVQLSDDGSDPVVSLSVRFRWRRPRPWQAQLVLPPPHRGWNEWAWRSRL